MKKAIFVDRDGTIIKDKLRQEKEIGYGRSMDFYRKPGRVF